MASTSLIAFATMLLSGSAGANDVRPHVVAVATARATIVSGVRAGPATADHGKQIEQPEARPRERPCPEAAQTPCRLIVTDLR